MSTSLTLAEAAEHLGVHYMTVYKYVRTGRLDAHKVGGIWSVSEDALADFEAADSEPHHDRRVSHPEMIEARLVAGDDVGAHQILNDALSSGAAPLEAYVDLLGEALTSIGAKWSRDELSIADEHMATTAAQRVVARLGARLAAKGRTKGAVVLAAVENDLHALPSAMLHDLLRYRRFDVLDLGANTPAESIATIVERTPDLIGIGLTATTPGNDEIIADTLGFLRSATDAPVVLGGGAIENSDHARTLGPCLPSTSCQHALQLFDDVLQSRSLPL